MSETAVTSASIADLLAVAPPERDKKWLRECLQAAVALELATIPPYLYAYWSVRDASSELADALLGIAWQEMLHMGLACNMLTAAEGKPSIVAAARAYPSRLPGGVRPGLVVPLKGVASGIADPRDALKGFMDIEEPEKPVTPFAEGPTIGQFYKEIEKELPAIADKYGFGGGVQVSGHIGGDILRRADTKESALAAMRTIREQGEGTSASPNGSTDPADRAHYYRFAEHWKGRRLQQLPPPHQDKWDFTGEAVERPALYPLGEVPAGGWEAAGDLRAALDDCNAAYGRLLGGLEALWSGPAAEKSVAEAMGVMGGMAQSAARLIGLQKNSAGEIRGPEFRPVHRA
ncbi:ferritin-like protein [Streptomyces sp. NPDC050610]|uniref:ferritin-like domain-containing protein n=1 Tax=Streptomyces sp. NPDC050610 TaxID=3157097 RepID=UPI0034202DEC